MYQTLSESASFCRRYDKTFWCLFRFTVLSAVYLQNANAKFYKVEYRHYSGEEEYVCLHFCAINLLGTICTKSYHNRSGFVDCISKNVLVCFSVHSVIGMWR